MNEIKRYDQALADQLEHLPMLPEDTAWAEMKKLLDEDDDNPVAVPFFRRTGCLLAGLVAALLLIIGGWFYFKRDAAPAPVSEQVSPVKGDTTNSSARTGSNGSDTVTSSVSIPDTTGVPLSNNQLQSGTPGLLTTRTGNDDNTAQSSGKKISTAGRSAVSITAAGFAEENDPGKSNSRKRLNTSSKNGSRTKAGITPPAANGDENTGEPADEKNNSKNGYKDPGKMNVAIQTGATTAADTTKKTTTDSSIIVKKDSLPVKKTTAADKPGKEEEEPKKKYWQLAAGPGVYQPIPISGEPAVPYNRYGRKGSLTDYIPAAYLRLYRSRKWFLHTEFRYGAPQAVKPFDYKQQLRDSFQVIIRTVYQLRKTYYHQVPLSFNYFVLPNLSVGAGIIYNRFTGAVARENVYRGFAVQDTLTSSVITSVADDERFVKNHFQWSAEAQYQWKRLSIGARYSSDINPYIKFTDIGNTGVSIEKKMRALNVFIRYDLWRSKKWGK